MKFTLSWLKKFLDINTIEISLDQIANRLTMIGLEVEEVKDPASELLSFEVAEIIKSEQHPNADKLKICKIRTKSHALQIVCGAQNARAGIKVVLAQVGTLIPKGNFKIKKSKIRDIESCGMLCSADELGISEDSDGIIELDSDAVIGEKVVKYLGIDDPVIDINITPNRADALGVYGIARDLAASGMGSLQDISIPKIEEKFITNYDVSSKDKKLCPFFAIREIKNLENKESPKWLKNLLNNIGINPVSALVDVTNYIAYSFGQPMHVYDADKIDSGLIIEELNSNTKFSALNDKEYNLKSGDLIIRDKSKIHCLAGIIGGQHSSCDINTKNIILEVGVFNPENISKTGRHLMLDTDSRYRFERNIDREFSLKALDIATNMIISICNGNASNVVQDGDPKLPIRKIEFPCNPRSALEFHLDAERSDHPEDASIDFLESRANIKLSSEEICNILTKLGFSCINNSNFIEITIPSWRYDVSIKEDIVEEIVRIHGYDKIPETPLPFIKSQNIIPPSQKRISDIKRTLANEGYVETFTWSFMHSKKAKFFSEIKDELTLINPISEELDYMRPSILPNLLNAVYKNNNRSITDLSLFEVGPVFKNANDETIINASGVRSGMNLRKNPHGDYRKFDIFDIKADIAKILALSGLDIEKCKIQNTAPDYYHPTRSASIFLGKNIIGYLGHIHPLILKEFDINNDVMGFEINISNLPYSKKKYGKKAEWNVSNYQMISRDYAFIIDQDQPIGELLSFIQNINKTIIRSVTLFDIYKGDKIDYGKQSVAFEVILQDNHKTMTNFEIEKIHHKIIDGITTKFAGILRNHL